MTRLKLFAAAALAAIVVGVGALVAAPTAVAMPRYSCSTALTLAKAYTSTGDILFAQGSYSLAAYYYGKATGILEASC